MPSLNSGEWAIRSIPAALSRKCFKIGIPIEQPHGTADITDDLKNETLSVVARFPSSAYSGSRECQKPGTTSGKGSRPGRELQRRHPPGVEGELLAGGPKKPRGRIRSRTAGLRRAAQRAWTLRARQTNHNQGRVFPLQNQLAGCVMGNKQTTVGVQTSDAGRASPPDSLQRQASRWPPVRLQEPTKKNPRDCSNRGANRRVRAAGQKTRARNQTRPPPDCSAWRP